MITVNLSTHKKVKLGWMIYLVINIHGNRKYDSTGLIVSKPYSSPLRHKTTGKILKDGNGANRYPKMDAKDKETWELARNIATLRRHQLITQESGLPDKKKRNANFIEFFESVAKIKKNNTYNGALYNLKQYAGKMLSFKSVTPEYLLKFQKALSTKVKPGTVNTYMQRFSIAWKLAMQQGYAKENPFAYVRPLKVEEKKLRYLELKELEALTTCSTSVPLIIQFAFLFSCMTGLRYGDIKNLKWEHIYDDYLEKIMDKGKKKILKVPLHPKAKEILSKLDRNKKLVFHRLPNSSTVNKKLKVWAMDAKIEKKISMHWGRHTMAVLARYFDVDIHKIKEILGHSSLTHTLIYANIGDETKAEAVNKIKVPEIKIQTLRRV